MQPPQQSEAMVSIGEDDHYERRASPSSSHVLNHRGDMASSSSSTLVQEPPASRQDVKKSGMDAMSLSKWNRLAEKGGIGTAVALHDCMANRKGELMFFAGDKITVLRVLIEESTYLGHCEGVIGRFYHEDVQFVQNSPSIRQPGDSSTPNADSSPSLTMNSSVPDQTTPTPTSQPPDSAPSYDDHKPSFADNQQEAAAQSPSMSSDSSDAFHTDNHRSISPNDNSSPTRSLAPSPNSSNRADKEQVQAMALALKTFAKDHHDDDLDVHDGLRSRQSRRSSTENSDTTWSSADEDGSDEDSEASIRYPTTISFIDRIKALRIPMTAAQEIQSSIPQNAEPPNLDDRLHYSEANTQDGTFAEKSTSSLETPETAVPMSIAPPPRPEKSQFRDQQLPTSEISGTARSDDISPFDDVQASEPYDIQQTQAEAAIHLARAIGTTSSQLVEEREKPALTFTRESSQFEFSSGLPGSSTPSGLDKLEGSDSSPPEMPSPPNQDSPREASEFAAQTVDTDEDIPKASNLLQIPEPVAREIANRFSTASDVLRKNYVNDVGVQSYFPVVDDGAPVGPVETEDALPLDSEGALAEQAGDSSDRQPTMSKVEDQDDSISTTNDAGLDQVVTSEVETSSHQSISETPLVGASREEASHTPVESEVAGEESDDEWDVSNHYAGISNSPPSENAGQLSARRHVSVLSDLTNTIYNTKVLEDNTPIDMDKKAGKGILKVHTSQSPSIPQQPGFSPQPVRTPIDVQALRNTALETSLSPDTARFRAFNFVSASATGTPTKSTGDLDVHRAALSPDGQQSTIATQLVQDDTLHGQLSMDLASARHPVPINFLLGHSVYSPQSETRTDSPLYGTPDTKPHQGGMDTFSPSPTLSRPSPSAPSSPFFPSSSKNLPSSSKAVPTPSEKPRARSFSKVEVIVPLHRSASANSLKAAYAGVPIQTPAEMKQHQDRENRAGGSRRSSLSRTGSSKLSAIRRKLSLKGEQRPDMAAILAKEDAPPLPTSSHSTPSTSHRSREPSLGLANSNTPEKNGTGVRNLVSGTPPNPATIGLGLPPLSVDPKNSFKVGPPVSHDDYRSPSIKIAEANFQMDDLPGRVAFNPPIPDSEPMYDEYGFLASESPVPQSFATMRPPEKEVSKLEQTLLALTEHPLTPSSDKKVKHLVESHSVPPSVRGRVWQWLLNAPPIPHHQYQAQVDSFEVPPLKMDQGLVQRFGSHRVFMHGFHTVEQMMFLYITRNRTAPPSPDTIWIASLFLTQSFHEAEGYALYQGFLQRMTDNGTDKQIKSWAQTVHEVVHAHDPELAQHLAKCLDLYYIPLRRWTFTAFAEALPLPTCLRAMDLIIVQGPTAIIKLASTLFLMLGKQLLKLIEPSEIISFLLHPPQDWMSPENVFRAMSKITLPKKTYRPIEAGKRR